MRNCLLPSRFPPPYTQQEIEGERERDVGERAREKALRVARTTQHASERRTRSWICCRSCIEVSSLSLFKRRKEHTHTHTHTHTHSSNVFSPCSPQRADLVAALGETTGEYALDRVRQKMLENKEGRGIINHRLRIGVRFVRFSKRQKERKRERARKQSSN